MCLKWLQKQTKKVCNNHWFKCQTELKHFYCKILTNYTALSLRYYFIHSFCSSQLFFLTHVSRSLASSCCSLTAGCVLFLSWVDNMSHWKHTHSPIKGPPQSARPGLAEWTSMWRLCADEKEKMRERHFDKSSNKWMVSGGDVRMFRTTSRQTSLNNQS